MNQCVLIISFAYPPSSAVGAFRPARFAKFLPETGWSPVVLTGESDKSTTLRDDSRLQWTDPGTIVVRARPWEAPRAIKRWWQPPTEFASARRELGADSVTDPKQPRGLGGSFRTVARRVLQAMVLPARIPDRRISWAIPALCALRQISDQYNPSVLLSTSPPHSTHLIATAFKLFTGIPLVIDLRDPWARDPWSASRDGPWMQRLDERLEKFCVSHADRVILNTPELLESFREHYPPRWQHKFLAIPNGYDPQIRSEIEALTKLQANSREPTPLRLCHAGTVYGRRDIRPLIEAVAQLNRASQSVVFEQVGWVRNRTEVAECIERNNAANIVQLLDQQTHEEALRRMAAADVLVVVRQNTPLQTPAKLYEMMLFGKPILALDDEGSTTRFVRDHDLGVVADPMNPAAIAQAISQIADRNVALPGPRRADALVKFDGRIQTRHLAEVLLAAVESRRSARR